jgi:UDP-GlcNAc:undecaprenyl-phosphate/decaprenyl-phosphate GlcNAc-1-phosphate transferase
MLYPVVSLIVTVLTMPVFIRMARRYRLYDIPDDERKTHEGMIPFTGGFAFVFAFTLVTGCMMVLEGNALLERQRSDLATMSIYIMEAGAIIFMLGVVDDFKNLAFTKKFLFQFFAVIFLILGATKSDIFPRFFDVESSTVFFNSLGTTISVLWFVGMTNAVNLIDGMDGLAGGTGFLIAMAFAALALVFGNDVLAMALFILAGALIGFLAYNLPPARVFMGDTGSMFLGFFLSVAGWLLVDSLPPKTTSFFVPVIIAGLPVSDTLLAFVRRVVRGQNPFSADTNHIHHVLQRRYGLGTGRTLLILLSMNAVFAGAGIAVALTPPLYGWIIIGAVAAGAMGWYHMLGYTRLMLFGTETVVSREELTVDPAALLQKRNGNGAVHPPVKSGLRNTD